MAAPEPLELLDVTDRSARLSELRLRSEALGRETKVRVLAPGPDAPADGPVPVLFLLHGGGADSDHSNWTDRGSAEALTEGRPLVVVMPDGGKGGWYSDWLRPDSAEGRQLWERYHVGELLPFVQSHFGTRADRAATAIAGLSMGGFGAVHYAARHPDLFGFAAAFSGAVDVRHPGIGKVVRVSPQIMGGQRGDIFGDHVADELVWRAANPVDLAPNLATVTLELRTGNGKRGGPYGDGPEGDTQEAGVSQATASLHRRLDELGIPHVYDDYGAGAHTWPYWDAALAATLPGVLATAAERRPVPATIQHLAYEPRFSVWGYDVDIDRHGAGRPDDRRGVEAGDRLEPQPRVLGNAPRPAAHDPEMATSPLPKTFTDASCPALSRSTAEATTSSSLSLPPAPDGSAETSAATRSLTRSSRGDAARSRARPRTTSANSVAARIAASSSSTVGATSYIRTIACDQALSCGARSVGTPSSSATTRTGSGSAYSPTTSKPRGSTSSSRPSARARTRGRSRST
jgi:S-formylglutathione hydrolase FrmB